MSRFGKTKVAKEEFYGTEKPMKNWDVNVDESTKLRVPHALVPYIPHVLRGLVPHVHRALHVLVL